MKTDIKLYGTERCHKTQHYKRYLVNQGLDFLFVDVEESETNADELKSLYETKKLNFPTVLIGSKKLRNPSDKELSKWLKYLCSQ